MVINAYAKSIGDVEMVLKFATNMKLADKQKFINAGILVSFMFMLSGLITDSDFIPSVGLVSVGLLFVFFKREMAMERYRIDKDTKNEFLKKYLYAKETVGRNRIVIFIVGLSFLIGGGISIFAALSATSII